MSDPRLSLQPMTATDERLDQLERLLGRPAYGAPGVRLYEGDCVKLLKAIPNGTIDLTVTSPPYNIGKAYEKPMPVDQYVAWCATWISGIHNATAKHGAFWLNLGYLELPEKAKAIPIPYLLWDSVPFYLIQEVVWNYGAGVACKTSFSPRNEKFLWYVKDAAQYTFNLDEIRDPDVKYPNQKKNGKLKCNPRGKNPTDVWQVPKVTSGADRASPERTNHPAQFPTAVIDRIINGCSNPGDLVLDPFMGSGSTAIAAYRSGRPVIGFEIDAGYIALAAKRLEREIENGRLRSLQQPLFA